ncbi:hypothetical protein [Sphingomonas metalli]|nr:hypothetical protein [Sphingomonas metalli]
MARIIKGWFRRWIDQAEAIDHAPPGACAICGIETPGDNCCAGCGPGGW